MNRSPLATTLGLPLMNRRLRVALLIETTCSYSRQLLEGVTAYGRDHGPWIFYHLEQPGDGTNPQRLRRWSPDGILARIASVARARQLKDLKIPTIDLLDETPYVGIPQVVADHRAIMGQAIDHLFMCGLQQLAYVGDRGTRFSEMRRQAFHDHLASLGWHARFPRQRPYEFTLRDHRFSNPSTRLAQWLRSLPKPIGVVVCNDARGSLVVRECSEAGIRVPDEVAVIGVDDDPLVWRLTEPSLSSVDPNARQVGYTAAELLHGLVERRVRLPRLTQLAPARVIGRQSTDVLAITDAKVVEVVRYLREHACNGLTVKKLSRTFSISRRTAERWVDGAIGLSPSEEIERIRHERVKALLASTDMPLSQIADRAGYSYVESMCRSFKSRAGVTPGGYRRATRPRV